jgi:hypothetical protein
MNRLLFVLAALLLTAPVWGQEVVIFQDYRSLVVQSHRVQGDWTYLSISSGELAVQSSLILEIRKEGSDVRMPALPTALPQPAAEPPKPSVPQGPRAIRPGMARPPQRAIRQFPPSTPAPMDEDDEDDDAEEDDEADDEVDDGEVNPAQPTPVTPTGMPINQPPAPTKPEGSARPAGFGRE